MNGNEKGLSLIEVLVSLVILVIGLIGVFNLHIISKQGSFESFQQTQASYLAHDIINRMKVNTTALADYDGTYNGSLPAPTKLCRDPAALCSATELKAADVYFWEQALTGKNEMNNNKGVGGLDTPIACIDVSGDEVEVVITWRSIRTLSDAATDHYSGSMSCGTQSDRRRALTVSTNIVSSS